MDTLLIFLLTHFFLDIAEKNQKPFFKLDIPTRFCMLTLNGAQNFNFIGFLYATLIG